MGFTFIRTGGTLGAVAHEVTLSGAANGLRDVHGRPLDGDANGAAGGNYVTSFVAAPGANVLTIPDFMRGPGQPVDVPANGAGIPLVLTWSGAPVTSLSFVLTYDPALLEITSIQPAGGGAPIVPTTPGTIEVTIGAGLPAAGGEVARIFANVPATAPYGAKHVLDLANVLVNGMTVAGGNDGLHLVGYFGDGSGDATYSSLDITRLQRVVLKQDSGFAAYPLVDPVIVADISGNGGLNALDISYLAQEISGPGRPEIPPLPATTPTIVFAGPDPALTLGQTSAQPGETVAVPLQVDQAAGVESIQARIAYDPAALEVVSAGKTGLTAGFIGTIDTSRPGVIAVDLATTNPLQGGSGSLVDIVFRVRPDARAGATALDLEWARLNDGALVLTPLPVDGADGSDGRVDVLDARRLRAARDLPKLDWSAPADGKVPGLVKRAGWVERFVSDLGEIAAPRDLMARMKIRLP
jgi:hypothetical protein